MNERKAGRFSGVYPVCIIPYTKELDVDVDDFQRQVDYMYEVGVSGIVLGQVSELMRFNTPERHRLVELSVATSADRGQVIVSTGAESTKNAVDYTRQAQSAGADCALVMHPSTTALDDREMLAYYTTIIECVDIPIMVHHAKSYAKQPLSLECQAELLRRFGPERVMFKPESSPTPPKLSKLRDLTEGSARIFEGDGGMMLLDAYKRGIAGTIPAADTAAVHVCLWRLLESGNEVAATPIAHALSYMMCIMMNSVDCYQTLAKHTLKRLGLMHSDDVRGPKDFSPDPETLAELDRTYDFMMALAEKA